MTQESEYMLSIDQTKEYAASLGFTLSYSMVSFYLKVHDSKTIIAHFVDRNSIVCFLDGVKYQRSLINNEVTSESRQDETSSESA